MRYGLKMFGLPIMGERRGIVFQFQLEYFNPLPFPADSCPAIFDHSIIYNPIIQGDFL